MEASSSTAHPSANLAHSQDAQTPVRRPSVYPRPLISTLGWDLPSILARSPNFRAVQRAHYTSPNARIDFVINEVERNGNPLIITGWNRHPRWPKSMFSIDWLRKNGDQNPTVRNVHNWADFKLPLDEFIRKLRECSVYASADEQERLYGKDGECPTEWTEWLTQKGAIPNELLFYGPNDFLKFLPDKAKVQTLMCYMGIGDTFTPFHKDLCASSGHNLMCFSEHSGSSFWFMTKSSAAPQVAAYFHQLGREIDLETHVITIEELANAPFEVFIAEQQPGDLVLVPPRSCHQVVNKGGITVKASWSRMSLHGLQTALWHELPIYHRVCRQEIYKVKSNIYHALLHLTKIAEDFPEPSGDVSYATTDNLKQLVRLFDDILAAEFSVARDSMPHVSQSDLSHTDNLHCDFCGADIFQSFFECDRCLPAVSSGTSAGILPVGDGLIICPLCYVEGRTCRCGEMQPVQCRPFNGLLRIRDQAVMAIQRIETDYINGHGYLLEQPDRLLSVGDVNIFEAACKLSQKRTMDTKTAKSCRAFRASSHQVPTAVYCRKCHRSECYTHLLELHSVHSVDAIIRSDRQDGENWHEYHRSCSQRYPEIRREVMEDEERGSRPNTLHQLTYLAKTFTTCRAIAVEMTAYGWYDRFAQTTSIPLANTPAKALLPLSDPIDGDEPCDSRASDDSPCNPVTHPRNNQAISPCRTSASLSVVHLASPEGILKAQPREADPSVTRNFGFPIVDPMSPSPQSGMLQIFSSTSGASTQTQLDTSVEDDLENLSDLTDLSNEFNSPPQNSNVAIPVPETSNQYPFASISSSSAPVSSSTTLFLNGPTLRSRLVFDCVEIRQPKWRNGNAEKTPSPSRPKRKRITAPSLAGSSDSDDIPSVVQRLKRSQGPASRLSPSSKHTHSPFLVQNLHSPTNFLANALNRTFQQNSTSPTSHVPSTCPILSASSPIKEVRYKHVGVQKNLNFTRHTPTSQSSEDPITCITRLQAENHDLRTDVETYKNKCAMYQETLEDLNRRYLRQPEHLFLVPPPPLSGTSVSASHPSPETTSHPRWRARSNIVPEHRSRLADQEPDLPPVEVLPPLCTPSSSGSTSTGPLRRTPTEPLSHTMNGRGDGRQVRPYGSPQRGRRRGFTEPTNGKRKRDFPRGPTSTDRRISAGNLTSPNSHVTEASGTRVIDSIDTAVARDHNEAPDGG